MLHDENGLPLALKPAELARQLGMSRSRVYQALAAGEIKGIRVLGSWRITRDELVRLLAGENDAR